MSEIQFRSTFKALTGNSPFPWQEALYERVVTGDGFPSSCNLPTGLGKTSVIPIWLIALANHPTAVPRRLVYVVNRRTVVDQATEEARKIRDNLPADLSQVLQGLCAEPVKVPLAISTLRGQFADNREWSADPARPAIIIGTVDMIGSRLLFSGYGVGFKSKPLHAGFLGQDVLLVHDEAHLEPAFQKLLIAIRDEQKRCNEFRPFQVMELSATSRGESSFGLSDKDRVDPEVRKRIQATKIVHLHENADEKKLPDQLAQLALAHKDSNLAVLVFARTVEAVEKVADKLEKAAPSKVKRLTGTLRGKERDGLVEEPVFRRFLPKAEPGEETVYLVCTSAGEVGVNLSADHIVCDLSTFESMAQRFGRVNRFGDRHDTRIDVVHPNEFDETKPVESRRKKTLALLQALNGDGSPAALDALNSDSRIAAFGPEPTILAASDILFDAWALTTIRGKLPGRPPVEPYLHGVAEWEPPETHVAWREEVDLIKNELLERYDPEELLGDYPIKPHEVLRDRSDRIFKHLASLAGRHADAPAWLLDDDGTVEIIRLDFFTLNNLSDKEKKDRVKRINFRTVLLPPSVGGLQGGILNGGSNTADDVADAWLDEKGQKRRIRIWDTETVPGDMRLVRVVDIRPDPEVEGAGGDETPAKCLWRWYVKPWSADDDSSKTSKKAVLCQDHTNDVCCNVGRIVKDLPSSQEVKDAVILAAKFHDLGKKRLVWQRSIGNTDPSICLAKSGGKMSPTDLTNYRHEFGSLLDAAEESELGLLDFAMRDVVLHLIAAHHGRGRPHFDRIESFDPQRPPSQSDPVAADVPLRFARLQRQYGRWGLAYLESLLRAADYAASANPSATMEDRP